MNPDDLVRMANQIAAFFRPYPHEEAVAGVADHLAKFWEARMLAGLARRIAAGGEGLDPVVLEAARRLDLSPPASA